MFRTFTHLLARRNMQRHPELQFYLEANEQGYRLGDSWEDCEFLVVDTETTGLNYRQDRILSIGAIRATRDTIFLEDSLDLAIRLEDQSDPTSIPVHGILPGEGEFNEKEALLIFLRRLGGKVIVAQHAAFDAGILEQRIRAWFPGFRLLNHVVDTALVAKKVDRQDDQLAHQRLQYSLDHLTDRYDILTSGRHTADGDAYMTAILLLKLLHRLKSYRIESLRSLVE